jgi:hypothetical protein
MSKIMSDKDTHTCSGHTHEIPMSTQDPETAKKKKLNFVEETIRKDNYDYLALFEGNKKFVQSKLNIDPHYFQNHLKGQTPKYLLIGCSDSRVPPDQLTATQPGDIFIHRNVANISKLFAFPLT